LYRFEYVLNYLRNGYIAHGDDDGDELFEMLEKEAQVINEDNLERTLGIPDAVFWHQRNGQFVPIHAGTAEAPGECPLAKRFHPGWCNSLQLPIGKCNFSPSIIGNFS
jgi:hypothetical protein